MVELRRRNISDGLEIGKSEKESQTNFRKVLEKIPDAVIVVDLDGLILFANSAAEGLLGDKKNGTTGQHFGFPVISGEKTEIQTLDPDNNLRIAEMRVVNIFWEQKPALLASIRDITERKHIEQAIIESQKRLENSLEKAPDGVYIIDFKGKFLFGNSKAEEILGYKREEILGKSFLKLNLLSAKQRVKAMKLLAKNAAGRPTGPDKFELIRKDRNRIWVEINTAPIIENEEKLVIGFVRDITERVKAEEELKQSHRFNSTLLECSPNPIEVIKHDTSIRYVNEAFERLTGYKDSEVIGIKAPYPWWTEKARNTFSSEKGNKKLLLEHNNKETEFRDKTGESFWVQLNSSRVTSEKGSFFIINWLDITERKNIETRLKKAAAEWRTTFDSIHDWVSIHDKNCKLLRINKSFANAFDKHPRELIGAKCCPLIHGSPNPLSNCPHTKAMKTGKPAQCEFHVDFLNIDIETSVSPIIDEKGAISGTVHITQDVTRRKKTEQELVKSEQRYSSLFRYNPDAVYALDLEGRFTDVNESCCSISGYSRIDFLGMTFEPLIVPGDLEKVRQHFTEAREGQTQHYETTIVGKEGHRINLSVTNMPIIVNDHITGVFGVAQNITEHKQTEEKLRLSENKYRHLFNNLTDAAFLADAETGNIIEANQQATKLLHRTYREIIGMHQLQLHPPDKAYEYRQRVASHIEKGRVVGYDGEIVTKDGAIVPVEISASTTEVEGRNLILGLFRDITERKKIEDELSRSEARFRRFFEDAPVYCYMISPEGNIIDVNTTALKTLGYSEEELIDKPLSVIYAPESRSKMKFVFEKWGSKGKVKDEEMVLVTKSGERRYVLLSTSAIKDKKGNILHSISIQRDITDRKRAQEALKASEKKFRLLSENTSDIVCLHNADHKYSYVSPSCKKELGYEPEELIGKNPWELVHPEDLDMFQKLAHEKVIKGESCLLDYRIRDKSGKYIWFESVSQTLTDKDDNILGFVTSSRNITERKQNEEELNSYRQHLEEMVQERTEELRVARDVAQNANKAKSEFLARMSHEIRTPIHGVMGTLDLINGTKLTNEQKTYVNMSKHSAETLVGVIDDILDFSKIEAGKIELSIASFDIREVVEEALETVAVKSHMKGLELFSHLSGETRGNVLGDAGRLRQVLVNLLGNAVKFTEHGEIGVSVTTARNNKKDVELHFAVSDTGMGIDNRQQKDIFDPFQQVDGSMSRKHGGTGLGLSICKQLVNLMGGEIWVRSKPGEGSTFHFTARFKKDEYQPIVSEELPAPVLLVDDHNNTRAMLSQLLSNLGFKVVEAKCAREALQEIHKATNSSHPFSLVLLDQRIEGLDGFELAREIKDDTTSNPEVVMMLLSDNISEDVSRCQEMSISNYLIKPVKQRELKTIIQKAIIREEEKGENKQIETSSKVLSELRILVAEDNVTSQLIARKMLERQGHNVTIVGNGLQACQILEKSDFDLVLMDVEMPEMNGLEATRSIREKEASSNQHVPIVAMTAYAMKEDREKCLEAGMDGYISKPVNLAEIKDFIEGLSLSTKELDLETFDLEAALKVVGGDKDILKEVVSVFLEQDYPEQLKQLKQGIDLKDASIVKAAAHSIKGASRSFGGRNVSAVAFNLEEMGKNNNLNGAEKVLGQLEQEIQHFIQCFNEEFKK